MAIETLCIHDNRSGDLGVALEVETDHRSFPYMTADNLGSFVGIGVLRELGYKLPRHLGGCVFVRRRYPLGPGHIP